MDQIDIIKSVLLLTLASEQGGCVSKFPYTYLLKSKFFQDQNNKEKWEDENQSAKLPQEEICWSWIRFSIVLFAIMKDHVM